MVSAICKIHTATVSATYRENYRKPCQNQNKTTEQTQTLYTVNFFVAEHLVFKYSYISIHLITFLFSFNVTLCDHKKKDGNVVVNITFALEPPTIATICTSRRAFSEPI